MKVDSNFTVAGYLTVPAVHSMVSAMRNDGKTWDNIADKLSSHIGIDMTGNALRKGWRNHSDGQSPIMATAYVSYPENREMINVLRNKRQKTWKEISDIIFLREGQVLSESALGDAWSKSVKAGFHIKQSTRTMDVIKSPDIHYEIGLLKNIHMRSWKQIKQHIKRKYKYDISMDHIENTWHEGVKQGMRVPVKFNAKDFVNSAEGYAEIKEWVDSGVTWRDIAERLTIRLGYSLTARLIRDYYSDCAKNDMDKKQECKDFLLKTMYRDIQKWRFMQFRSWTYVANKVSEEYGEVISSDMVKDIIVGHMNFVKAENIRKEVKQKKRIMSNGKKFNAREYLSNSENREEIKMWKNHTNYSWKEIAERISKRVGVSVTASSMTNAFYE